MYHYFNGAKWLSVGRWTRATRAPTAPKQSHRLDQSRHYDGRERRIWDTGVGVGASAALSVVQDFGAGDIRRRNCDFLALSRYVTDFSFSFFKIVVEIRGEIKFCL